MSIRKFRVFATLFAVCLLSLGAIFLAFASPQKAKADLVAPNLPANGKILFLMGQNSDTLSAYQTSLQSNPATPAPGGVTLYTNIVAGGNPPPLAGTGVDGAPTSINYGTGTMNFSQTLAQYPNAALAVGLYLSDSPTCDNVPLRAIAGPGSGVDLNGISQQTIQTYQGYVHDLISYLKGLNRAVFLRIGYEFDNPYSGCYNAQDYIAAFQSIKNQINAQGASQVATVWQSALWPQNVYPNNPSYDYAPPTVDPNHFNEWYPGDQYVDYVGMSYFYGANWLQYQWLDGNGNPEPYAITERDYQNDLLTFARGHSKPVMIAESSPQGFDLANDTASSIFVNKQVSVSPQTIWNTWYQDYFNFIESNSDVIRVVSYINDDWNNESVFSCAPGASAGASNCSSGYWGDASIQDNPTIYQDFVQQISCNLFVNGTQNCGSGGGSTPTPGSTPTATPTPGNTPTPTPTPSSGTIAIPGTLANNVGNTSNGQTLTYSVNAASSGDYYIQVQANASQASSLLSFSVDNNSIGNAAFGPGSATVQPPDFNLSAGTHTISITVESSGVSIASIVVNERGSGGSPTPTPTPTQGGGTLTVPGTLATNVGNTSNGQTLTYTINAASSGEYYIQVQANAAQASSLLSFSVDGNSIGNAAFGPGSATVQPPDFTLSAGTHTISITVESSGVSISSIVVNER